MTTRGSAIRPLLWTLLPLAIMALVAVVLWRGQDGAAKPAVTLACADLAGGCDTLLGAKRVRVGMLGELKPLKPIRVWLDAPGAKKVEARFTMQGMDMGFNLYTLRPEADGRFVAHVTLPVCVTGRRDWVMHITIDQVELAVPFVTDL